MNKFSTINEDDMNGIFSQVKEKLLQEWHNFYFEQSYRQAAAYFETIALSPAFEKKQLKASLENLTFEDFRNLVTKNNWNHKSRLIWFLHGNLSKT
jgi:secreted Zn-dependent insulinase-like peptidase